MEYQTFISKKVYTHSKNLNWIQKLPHDMKGFKNNQNLLFYSIICYIFDIFTHPQKALMAVLMNIACFILMREEGILFSGAFSLRKYLSINVNNKCIIEVISITIKNDFQ